MEFSTKNSASFFTFLTMSVLFCTYFSALLLFCLHFLLYHLICSFLPTPFFPLSSPSLLLIHKHGLYLDLIVFNFLFILVLSFLVSLLGAIDLYYFISVPMTPRKVQTYYNAWHQKSCLVGWLVGLVFVCLFVCFLLRHYISQTFCSCTNTWEKN